MYIYICSFSQIQFKSINIIILNNIMSTMLCRLIFKIYGKRGKKTAQTLKHHF